MKRPNQKGASFERKIAKELSLWWTDGERDDVFWRTSQSGGRATQRNKSGKATAGSYGDIMAVDPIGQPLLDVFTFELKRGYNRATVQDLLDSKTGGEFMKFIEQVVKDMDLAGSNGAAIIHQRDQRAAMITILNRHYANKFSESFVAGLGSLTFFVEVGDVLLNGAMMRLDVFLEHAKPWREEAE